MSSKERAESMGVIQIPLDSLHEYIHNNNDLFYSLHPPLLMAIVHSFDLLKTNSPHLLENGSYYEFGLFKGFSFYFAEAYSRDMTGINFRYWGFDSFAGLPESKVDKHRNWGKGAYAVSLTQVMANLKKNGTVFERLKLVPGFFSAELFARFDKENTPPPPAILVVDTDIYESCCIILEAFGHKLVSDSILLFDDFNAFGGSDEHGERRALREYRQKNGWFKIEHLFTFGKFGQAFQVT